MVRTRTLQACLLKSKPKGTASPFLKLQSSISKHLPGATCRPVRVHVCVRVRVHVQYVCVRMGACAGVWKCCDLYMCTRVRVHVCVCARVCVCVCVIVRAQGVEML
jgi:hypothetical protein